MVLPNMSSLSPARPEEILLPARPWFILVTLLAGLLANLVPLSGVALALRPDFLALVLLYWCIQAPRYVGVGVAWCVGILMDVGDGTVLGQHAFAYAFLAYAAEYFRRRVLRFPLWQQAAQVAVLLFLCAALVRALDAALLPSRWRDDSSSAARDADAIPAAGSARTSCAIPSARCSCSGAAWAWPECVSAKISAARRLKNCCLRLNTF